MPVIIYDGSVKVRSDRQTCQGDVRLCSSPSEAQDKYNSKLMKLLYYDEHESENPALISFGGMSGGMSATQSLYINNPNPIPIDVVVSSAQVASLRLELGKVKTALSDLFPLGGATDLIEGPETSYQDSIYTADVTFDSEAHDVFLELYDKHASPKIQQNAETFNPKQLLEEKTKDSLLDIKPGSEKHVDEDTGAVFLPKIRNSNANGVLVSLDGRFEHKLAKKSKPRSSKREVVTLPPGGVARFDVTLTAPPADVLKGGVTKFIATGLEVRVCEERSDDLRRVRGIDVVEERRKFLY